MSQGNVDLVKSFIPPAETDYTVLLGDDAAWYAAKEATEPSLAPDFALVVLGHEHGYRRDTEAEVEAESAGVYFLRDGKIARIEYYANRAEALEAVGLSAQDAHADL